MKPQVILVFLAAATKAFTVPLSLVEHEPSSHETYSVTLESLKTFMTTVTRTLENRSNMQYRGTLLIGTPPKAFSLIFDTGSSWLWVTNSTCDKSCHRVASAYDHRNSTSYRNRGFRVTLEYGMGTAVGTVGTETVWLTPSLSAPNQTFAVVYRNSGFGGMKADGLLGLGFKGLADNNATIIDNLYENHVIPERLFSIYLSDNDFGRKPAENFTSEITFGFWDLKKYARGSELTYLNVYSNTGYWAVSLKSVHIGNDTVAGSSFIGIIDTGTSLLIGPSAEVQTIFSYFIERMSCKARGSMLDCACGPSLAHLPDLYFALGNDGYVFTIKPERYVIHRNNTCVLLFDSMQDDGMWILGDVFLRSYYAVFDMGNSRIGLISSKNNDVDVSIFKPPVNTAHLIIGFVLVVFVIVLVALFISFIYRMQKNNGSLPSPVPRSKQPLKQRLLDS